MHMKKYQVPSTEMVEVQAMKCCMTSPTPPTPPGNVPPIDGDNTGDPTI